jgi:hypothetical protein
MLDRGESVWKSMHSQTLLYLTEPLQELSKRAGLAGGTRAFQAK